MKEPLKLTLALSNALIVVVVIPDPLMDKAVAFPLYLRIPGWCQSATVSINGKKLEVMPEAGKFVRIERKWENDDAVVLTLPMKVSVQTWTANHDSVSVDYGPLTFSLKIGERYERKDSTAAVIFDSGWQKTANPSKWPAFEIYPTTPWNYGLILNNDDPAKSFTVKKLPWPKDNYPFAPQSAPIEIEAKAKQIPQWTLDQYEPCSVLQQSPVWSDQPVEQVTLIPMGAARLRISAFPTISSEPLAHRWVANATSNTH